MMFWEEEEIVRTGKQWFTMVGIISQGLEKSHRM